MFETSIDIDAGLAQVWAVLVDVERWPEWTESVSKVELEDPGPLLVGSRVRIKQPRLPSTVWEVTVLEPVHVFTWKAAAPGVTTFADHRLTGVDPSAVRATLAVRRTGPLAPLLDALLRGITRRYVRLEAEGLKRRCEGGT